MTHAFRTPLYRQLAAAFFSIAMLASAVPAHAQRGRPGNYHRQPSHYQNRGYRGGYRGDRRGGGNGNIVAGALLGVIAGVAISNASQRPPPDVVYRSAPPPPPPGVVYYPDNGY